MVAKYLKKVLCLQSAFVYNYLYLVLLMEMHGSTAEDLGGNKVYCL
jgi:hypothetical protein